MTAVLLHTAYAERAQAISVASVAGAVGVAFLSLAEEQQDQALEREALRIDALDYAGTPVSASQPLSFPRNGARSDALRRLAQANIEEAMVNASKYASDATASMFNLEAGSNGNIKAETTGPLKTEYFAAGTYAAGSLEKFSPTSRDLLQPLLASATKTVSRMQWGQGSARRVS